MNILRIEPWEKRGHETYLAPQASAQLERPLGLVETFLITAAGASDTQVTVIEHGGTAGHRNKTAFISPAAPLWTEAAFQELKPELFT